MTPVLYGLILCFYVVQLVVERLRGLLNSLKVMKNCVPICLGEKSNHMVTVTPFMGKLKVHIQQFYINRNGEIKPSKSCITLEIEEFYEWVECIPQIKMSIERYEHKDTGIPLSPFKLDLPVLDLDTVFLPSPPTQELIPMTRDEKLLDSQPKFPSPPTSTFSDVTLPLIDPSPENELDDLNFFTYVPGEGKKSGNEQSIKSNKKLKTENKRPSGIFCGVCYVTVLDEGRRKKEEKDHREKGMLTGLLPWKR